MEEPQTYYQRNRERCLQQSKEYQEANKEYYKQYNREYYLKKKALLPPKPPKAPKAKPEPKPKKPRPQPQIIYNLSDIQLPSILTKQQALDKKLFIVSFD